MSTKEQLFEAWNDWDTELDDPLKKQAAKNRLDALTDQYKKEADKGGSRTMVRFYLRDEYADWAIKNR